MENHPLTKMVRLYCDQYKSLRENNLDESNMSFHRKFGLRVQSPESWDILSCVNHVLNEPKICENVVIIFSSSLLYRKFYDVFGDDYQYMSWHEVYTGMHIASSDVRYIQRAKKILGESDMVFFVDPPEIPELVDQVCGQTSGGLVILS